MDNILSDQKTNQHYLNFGQFLFIGMIYFIITSIIPGGYLTAEDTYYFLNITDALITVVYIHGYLGFCYYISKKLPEVLINVFTTLSKNI